MTSAVGRVQDALTEALNTKKLALRKLQVLLPRVELGLDAASMCEPRQLMDAQRTAILDEELQLIGKDAHYYSLLSKTVDGTSPEFPWEDVWTRTEAARIVTIDPKLTPRQLHLAVKSVSSNLLAVNRVNYGSLVLQRLSGGLSKDKPHSCPDASASELSILDLPTPLSQVSLRLRADSHDDVPSLTEDVAGWREARRVDAAGASGDALAG